MLMRIIHKELENLLNENNLSKNAHPDLKSWQTVLDRMNLLLEEKDSFYRAATEQLHRKVEKYVLSTAKLSSLSKMVGGVAHEINTPLAVIQIRSDQLLEEIQANNFKQDFFEKSILSIHTTVKRIGEIVNRLRTYAVRAGKEEVLRISLKKLIEDTIAISRDRFTAHFINLEFIPTEDIEIECRPSDISQILISLFNNSLEAVKNLKEKWIHVEYKKMQDLVLIEITDSGSGIDAAIQQKITNPFFTTSETEGKLGLGLSVAKGFAEEHGGALDLDPSSKNTKFKITLPMEFKKN